MTTLNYGSYILYPQMAPIMSPIGNYSMNEFDTLEVMVSASDPNGHYLTFTADILPTFVQIINNGDGTAIIRITPDYMDAGTYNNIQIIVTDSGNPSMSDTEAFNLTVHNVNLPPIANALSSTTEGSPTLSVSFSAVGSTDLDGTIRRIRWDFDDGATASISNVTHNFDVAGKYYVVLTVTDNERTTGRDTIIIKNHPDLSQLFISEVSHADQSYGEFLEIFNNNSYDVNLREFKLVQRHRRGYIREIYDMGSDEVWEHSEMILPLLGLRTGNDTF